MAEEKIPTFEEVQRKLQAIDVSSFTEKKNGLTYLSWSYAWGELIKVFPYASYEIERFGETKEPFLRTSEGYMVFTKISIQGYTREMWLPVMDNRNQSIKVGQCDMNAINKAIMRCLVKNIAMFGLGLNVYQGEDLPNVEDAPVVKPKEHCADCGREIEAHGKIDGASIAERTKSTYGRPLCYDCATKVAQSAKPAEVKPNE